MLINYANQYLLIINIITLIVFAIDKKNAVLKRTRIRITTLLGLSLIGGSLGGFISMYLFRHKTKVNYFTIGLPIMMVIQLVLLLYLNCSVT